MIANFIDIDYTLWDNDAKWWIINKSKPTTYIKRIDSSEAELIKSGHYRNDELPIYYNGINGFISKELLSTLHIKGKVKIEDIGLSNREFRSPEHMSKQLSNFIEYSNVLDIFNKIDDYYLITKRANKNIHQDLIKNIKTLMNINIVDEYFINDRSLITNTGPIIERKIFTLLQHLIGYTINNNTIEPLIIKKYKTLNYFTDSINIDEYKNISRVLKTLLNNCPEFLKNKIESYIKMNDVYLNINVLTSNEINPFKKEQIKIIVD